MYNKGIKAFSLVELSIVLVILGLLVGGVLGGRSLIKAAELRTVTTELNQWKTAINTFRIKYHFLPGDLPNATQFWGAAAGGGSGMACNTFVSTGTETCNGNGNGKIEITEELTLSNGYLRIWQHLANAGLIEG